MRRQTKYAQGLRPAAAPTQSVRAGVFVALLLVATPISAEEEAEHGGTVVAVPSSPLRSEVERLRSHVKQLEDALARNAPVRRPVHTNPEAAMMAGMGQMMASMMGGTASPAGAAPPPLAGFSGSQHLYHVGAAGFFLDSAGVLALSNDQQARLRLIKDKSTVEQAEMQRKIADAEQQMWTLTAADRPDTAKIEAKAREIEKLRTDKRLAFIRAVGEAARVLTDAQRTMLVGRSQSATPDGGAPPADSSANTSGSGMGPM